MIAEISDGQCRSKISSCSQIETTKPLDRFDSTTSHRRAQPPDGGRLPTWGGRLRLHIHLVMPEQGNKQDNRQRHAKQPKDGAFSQIHDVLLNCVPSTRGNLVGSANGTHAVVDAGVSATTRADRFIPRTVRMPRSVTIEAGRPETKTVMRIEKCRSDWPGQAPRQKRSSFGRYLSG